MALKLGQLILSSLKPEVEYANGSSSRAGGLLKEKPNAGMDPKKTYNSEERSPQ